MTIFTGNIVADAKTRLVETSKGKTTVTEFSVAENYQAGSERATQFYRVSLWRDAGAKLEKYLLKGRSITLQGRVKPGAYISKDGKAIAYLQMANPQITFNTANPTADVEAVVEEIPEGAEEAEQEKPF